MRTLSISEITDEMFVGIQINDTKLALFQYEGAFEFTSTPGLLRRVNSDRRSTQQELLKNYINYNSPCGNIVRVFLFGTKRDMQNWLL